MWNHQSAVKLYKSTRRWGYSHTWGICMCCGMAQFLTFISALAIIMTFLPFLALHDYVSMLSTVLIWRHITLCGLQRRLWNFNYVCSLLWNIKFKVISYKKMHMISILVRNGFRWHSDKPYRTRLRLIRYGLSECHLNPYRTRMDTICISYHSISHLNLLITGSQKCDENYGIN